jgi:hypothetical protein
MKVMIIQLVITAIAGGQADQCSPVRIAGKQGCGGLCGLAGGIVCCEKVFQHCASRRVHSAG